MVSEVLSTPAAAAAKGAVLLNILIQRQQTAIGYDHAIMVMLMLIVMVITVLMVI